MAMVPGSLVREHISSIIGDKAASGASPSVDVAATVGAGPVGATSVVRGVGAACRCSSTATKSSFDNSRARLHQVLERLCA